MTTFSPNRKSILLLLFIFFSISFLFTNNVNTYRLINSDHLQVNKLYDEYITFFRGNVHFFYNDIEFFADRAELYEKRNYLILKGNVNIVQDSLSISCEEAMYYKENEHLTAQGNVEMIEQHNSGTFRRINSNIVTHYRDKHEFILQGNVIGYDSKDSLNVKAGYAIFNNLTGYGYLIQKPLLWRSGKDSLSLSAEKIEFFNDNKKIVASFDVISQNSEAKVICDFLIYYGDEEKLVYIGNPKFYSEYGDGYADLITVFLSKNQIKSILLENNCYITFSSEDKSDKSNWVSSHLMKLHYKNNKPHHFLAESDVKTYFKQDTSKNKMSMNNNVSGEILSLFLNEYSEIYSITILDKVKGKYRFERKK